MKVNFYLDKPYNPDISPEKVKQELAKVGGKKKNLAQKFWNPSPTALYLFFSPDKSCRIKYRTNYKILPKSWDFEKERLKPSASGALEFNVELNNLANCCTREAMRKKETNQFLSKEDYSKESNQYFYPGERTDVDMSNGDFEVKVNGINSSSLQLVSTTEDSLIHPTSVYGITKQVQGQLVHLICSKIGKQSVSFRYQNVYGPGQSLSNPYTGILSIFSTRIKNGHEINIFEDGKESRDFVYIEDVVDATILGIEKDEANGHAFNVGSGVPIDVLSVAQSLIKQYGIQVPIRISGNFRLGDIRHNYADISLAQRLLGYAPKWTFDAGIKEFCDWVNKQELQKDKYEESIFEMKEKGLYK